MCYFNHEPPNFMPASSIKCDGIKQLSHFVLVYKTVANATLLCMNCSKFYTFVYEQPHT